MTKRLRILAGPNGSGKTSVYEELKNSNYVQFGIFVNADEIEKKLADDKTISFDDYQIEVDGESFINSYNEFLKGKKSSVGIDDFTIQSNALLITSNKKVDSYFASHVASYIRDAMLEKGISKITIETVMSHESKLELIKKAIGLGYRVYLYFVTTVDPEINVERVKTRVKKGGHNVAKEKIISRYSRSLGYLYDAMIICNRSYLFDNSGTNYKWIAEYDLAEEKLEIKNQSVPIWFREYVFKPLIEHNQLTFSGE